MIDYYLQPGAAGEVTLEIYDHAGKLVRKYSSEDRPAARERELPFPDYWLTSEPRLGSQAGLHRWVWDLRYPRPPGGRGNYSMAAVAGRKTPALPEGPLALPGTYEVRLTVGGQTYKQPLTVKMDPRVKTPAADLVKQFELGMAIWHALQDIQQGLERGPAQEQQAGLRRLSTSLASLATIVDTADRAPTLQARQAFERDRKELDGLLKP